MTVHSLCARRRSADALARLFRACHVSPAAASLIDPVRGVKCLAHDLFFPPRPKTRLRREHRTFSRSLPPTLERARSGEWARAGTPMHYVLHPVLTHSPRAHRWYPTASAVVALWPMRGG